MRDGKLWRMQAWIRMILIFKNGRKRDKNMKVFNNVTDIVCDDMEETMTRGSKVSVAAACFSMYAYKELRKQLEGLEEFRFIFTSPTFVTDKVSKEKREFYIPRIGREQSLYGTEFEIKLRNEMTQKAIARECADWIKRKAKFKSNTSGENMTGFMTVDNEEEKVVYTPLNGFTTVDIGCDRGNNAYNMVNRMESPVTEQYMQIFEGIWNDKNKLQDVTDVVIENITSAYNENSPEFIYFMTLYHVFSEFLEDISEDVLPNEATGFKQSKIWNMLYDFQKDAVLAIINKLEKYNGCILADSVGLGKTFTALAVMKYYENRNKSVLVLCPKKLAENWNTYKDNYVNNPIASDRLNYTVLFHTDLSRNGGYSNGIDLDRLNWGNYDLVVIDESHNFRNGAGTHANTVENRYATYETPGNLEDKKLHKMIDNLNPDLRVSKNREFFIMSPEDAFELLEAIAVISGSQDKLRKVKTIDENKSYQVTRKPAIDFYKCGLKDGDELVCTENPQVVAIIKSEHKVLYNNELTSLTAIMKKIKGYSNISGPSYFTYKGELLTDIAKKTQWKE